MMTIPIRLSIIFGAAAIFFAGCVGLQQASRKSNNPKVTTMQSIATIQSALNSLPKNSGVNDYDRAWSHAELELALSLPAFGEDVAACAMRIVKEALNSDDITLRNNRIKNGATGLSGNPIFFAQSSKKTLAVVKAFPVGQASFAKELWAQAHLLKIGSHAPPILALGICKAAEEPYFLLASEYIEGVSLNDAILSLASLPAGEARSVALNNLLPIAQKLGTALGQLHRAGQDYHGIATRYISETQKFSLDASLRGLQIDENFGFPPADLAAYFASMMKIHGNHEYRYAFVHGDAHPGNYLYDPKQERIVLLDLGDGAYSIGPLGQPQGAPFADYMRIVASIRVRQIFGLTCQEFLYLKHALDDGYVSAGAKLPSLPLEEFYKLMEILSYFEWYYHHAMSLPKEIGPTMRQIFTSGAGWLKDAIDGKNTSPSAEVCLTIKR